MNKVIDFLAVYRITRLITADALFDDWRDSALEEIDLAHQSGLISAKASEKIQYLLTCPWCMSIWVAGAVAVIERIAPKAWRVAASVLAASAVAGLLASNE